MVGQVVRIDVGEENPVTFHVHESIICGSSEYFKRALNGPWRESKERRVVFEDVESDTFNTYVNFLYRDKIPVRSNLKDETDETFLLLAKAYVLGDMLQDGRFKDASLDAIAHTVNSRHSVETPSPLSLIYALHSTGPVVKLIYENTLDSSPARRLLLDIYQYRATGVWVNAPEDSPEPPKEFLRDLSARMLNLNASQGNHQLPFIDQCRYHDHHSDGTKACYLRQNDNPAATDDEKLLANPNTAAHVPSVRRAKATPGWPATNLSRSFGKIARLNGSGTRISFPDV